MATFDDVAKNSTANMGEVLANLSIDSLSTLARGLIIELISPNINNFNTMNYDFMNIHMMRNRYENEITLNSVGENAYTNGNPDATAAPLEYSYTRGNNYMEFVTNVHNVSKNGVLSTRVGRDDSEVKNLYFDDDNNNNRIDFTGESSDRNSILYKTKKLIKLNKFKTIISKFHTSSDVEYTGQVGTDQFGESHGRNLLTKDAETGGSGYDINGYDNPYCRVWTHHHKYDKISKTMRSNSGGLNRWGNFEWNQNDKGHGEDSTTYGDGERYDYAWRGKHNQDRREVNSVLDTKTGLVKMTPQFRGGGSLNRHTKECMFSIENLAWKDYDPFSFEEALSWEQRGPFGGRIMWFPPYGIEIQETTSAKWNSNDFIGRGEPVYTYVNSERTGNLSFLMLTDHPSSIDYASWWDDNNMAKNTIDSSGNCENDYLRYFAGCSNGNPSGNPSGNNSDTSVGEENLILQPTPLTDEYPKDNPPLIELKKEEPKPKAPKKIPAADKAPEKVEFFVFFPNNYSGVHDSPTVNDTLIDAITYLLAGRNAEKNGNENDRPIHPYSNFSTTSGRNIGYEMGRGPITTSDCIEQKQYIQGGVYGKNQYIVDKNKKWCYRIDHNQPYDANNKKRNNFICEKLNYNINYSDTKDFKINFDVSQNTRVQNMAETKENLYSFAELAAAIYSEKVLNYPNIYNYLIEIGVNQDRVNKLIDLFSSETWVLKELKCNGIASSHGHPENNRALSNNRAATLINWLHTNEKWRNIQNSATDNDNQVRKVDEVDRKNVSGESAKLFRCAHCVMTFSSSKTVQTNEPDEPVEDENKYIGFKYIESVPQADGSVWDYYEKDGSVTYYEQEGGSADNYEDPSEGDIIVTEQQILDIFNTEGFKPFRVSTVRTNSNYRGLYNEFGVYITTFDYSKEDDPNIQEFINGMVCYKDSYIFHQRRFYKTKENYYDGIWDEAYFNDITDIMATYAKGDIVLYDDDFYTCKEDFSKQHQDYTFDDGDWEVVGPSNITEAIRAPYRFVQNKPATGYEEKDITTIVSDNNIQIFVLCTKRNYIQPPAYDVEHWEQLSVDCYEDGRPGDVWNEGDYVTYDEGLYCCRHDGTPYTGEFNENDWDYVEYVYFSDLEDIFREGEIVEYQDGYYKALCHINRYEWTADLKPAMPRLICNSENEYGEFDGNYCYNIGDYCGIPNSSAPGLTYYKSLIDFSEKEFTKISFSNVDWEPTKDEDLYMYEFDWELANLVVKSAGVLCWTEDKMFSTITKGAPYAAIETNDKYSCIWKYGTTNNLNVDTSTNLTSYANLKETTSLNYDDENVEFRFTQDEEKYLETMYNENNADKPNIEINELRSYIILYRVLDNITKIKDTTGTRNVCKTSASSEEVMNEKTIRKDEAKTLNCKDVRWVDRGDGLLIQACNIKDFNDISDMRGRIVNGVAEGELNKLRYDQEYHFYKQWIEEHPLMFEKLQEKIKYFNPAFHSMTPEGFNARCTFLQQCTRQGNTKTMSDQGGKTANNLAFGRPPYCVLRLGDFYYQMIVIDNISFDYNVADGIQWDLNTEGNGVQPMLCKVNISFKFVGGGDITGPVQRLQNAMSFNYYANTSFYDNRADRVQYQPTNWKTMGGAGNNEVDIEKSYAYIAKRYQETGPNMVTPVQ